LDFPNTKAIKQTKNEGYIPSSIRVDQIKNDQIGGRRGTWDDRRRNERGNRWNPRGIPNGNGGMEMNSVAGSVGNDGQRRKDTFP
jgi:hypothetical protein